MKSMRSAHPSRTHTEPSGHVGVPKGLNAGGGGFLRKTHHIYIRANIECVISIKRVHSLLLATEM